MAKKKKRIKLDEAPAALSDAFGGLSIDGLAAGPESVEASGKAPDTSRKSGSVCLRRETAHRGGKAVVVIYDFPTSQTRDSMEDLAKALKQRCGCGGTVKNREVIIQGEKIPEVRDYLQDQGYRVRGVTS